MPEGPASPSLLATRRGLMLAALPAIAIVAVLGALLALRHRDSSVAERRLETRQLAEAAATNARRFLEDQFAILAAVAASPVVRETDLPAMRPFLRDVARAGRFTAGLDFVDTRGRAVVSSTRPASARVIDLSDRVHVRRALAGRTAVSDVLLSRTDNRPIIAFGYPTTALSGKRNGLLAGRVALDQFDSGLKRLLYASGAGEAVIDGAGNVIVGRRAVRGLQPAPRWLPLAKMRRRGDGVLDKVQAGQDTRVVGFAGVRGTDWLVIIDRDRSAVIGPADRALWVEIAALGMLALVGVLITFAAGRRLDRLDRERDASLAEQRTIALRLQRSLLPELPDPEGLAVHAAYVPAQGEMSVGGDWYDVVDMGDGRFALSVGDVAGHGLGAAAVMGQLRSAVRTLALARSEPVAALTQLDRFSRTLPGGPLATMVYAVLDRRTGSLRYALAGHPPPLVVRADGTTVFLSGGRSPLLGVDPTEPRAEAEFTLAPGDTLIAYTDGVVERPDATIDEGLRLLAARAQKLTGDCAAVTDGLLAFVPEPRRDDAAVLCVRLSPVSQPSRVAS